MKLIPLLVSREEIVEDNKKLSVEQQSPVVASTLRALGCAI